MASQEAAPSDYAPKKERIIGGVSSSYPPHHQKVAQELEEEIDKIAGNVLIQEPAGSSVVEDHFINQGERIAIAMEEQARVHKDKADQYHRLAKDAREAAKVQAKAAAAHEDRMMQIAKLLDQNL